MSSLKDRLKRLTGTGSGVSSGEEASERGSSLERGVSVCGHTSELPSEPSSGDETARGEADEDSLGPDWDAVGAKRVSNEWGSFIRRRILYPPGHRHGRYRLSDLTVCAGELAAFHEGGTVAQEDLLFFDTETTGLGLGAGNVPFMIGIGFWEPEGFAVEQLFIRSPAEEAAMLAYLRRVLERHPYLVSYNGRSFDWPVLKNRFVLNRMKDGIPEPVQLDFLYPSRSLWRNTLPSCRLGKVEEGRLGFQRKDDIPGSMAPELYFLYLAEKDPRSVEPVFLHNEWDVLSLAGLAVHFARALGGLADTSELEPEERYRLGLWLDKLGKRDLSLEVLEPLTSRDGGSSFGHVRSDCSSYWLAIAAHYKRIGEWERAVLLWQELVLHGKASPSPAGPSLEPYIELSMHFEHRMKDPASALMFAEEALDWALRRRSALRSVLDRPARRTGRSYGTGPARLIKGDNSASSDSDIPMVHDLSKRIERLRRKLERKKAVPAIPAPGLPAADGICADQGPGANLPLGKSAPNRPKARKRTSEAAVQETLKLF